MQNQKCINFCKFLHTCIHAWMHSMIFWMVRLGNNMHRKILQSWMLPKAYFQLNWKEKCIHIYDCCRAGHSHHNVKISMYLWCHLNSGSDRSKVENSLFFLSFPNYILTISVVDIMSSKNLLPQQLSYLSIVRLHQEKLFPLFGIGKDVFSWIEISLFPINLARWRQEIFELLRMNYVITIGKKPYCFKVGELLVHDFHIRILRNKK